MLPDGVGGCDYLKSRSVACRSRLVLPPKNWIKNQIWNPSCHCRFRTCLMNVMRITVVNNPKDKKEETVVLANSELIYSEDTTSFSIQIFHDRKEDEDGDIVTGRNEERNRQKNGVTERQPKCNGSTALSRLPP